MSNLKMSLGDIKKQMKFNCRGFWNHLLSTNCYAFALGLDIPEDNILMAAYNPGTIGSITFNIKSSELNKMSLEERIYLDLRALDISYSECSPLEKSINYFDEDYIIEQWIIAIFKGERKDFHFMRKSWDNDWWHKRGYNLEYPINYDAKYDIIYNPLECSIDKSYKYVKCLKLSCKTKWE